MLPPHSAAPAWRWTRSIPTHTGPHQASQHQGWIRIQSNRSRIRRPRRCRRTPCDLETATRLCAARRGPRPKMAACPRGRRKPRSGHGSGTTLPRSGSTAIWQRSTCADFSLVSTRRESVAVARLLNDRINRRRQHNSAATPGSRRRGVRLRPPADGMRISRQRRQRQKPAPPQRCREDLTASPAMCRAR